MSDTKQRSWRELLMEDFKATRARSGDDSYGEMLARVDAWSSHLEHVESQNQALQERIEDQEAVWTAYGKAQRERAEKAEALLRDAVDLVDTQTVSEQGWHDDVIDYFRALSPTQETDEPDCTRCGNERTVGGYGTDERFPCPVCRPTQEADRG